MLRTLLVSVVFRSLVFEPRSRSRPPTPLRETTETRDEKRPPMAANDRPPPHSSPDS
ncbi:hypothetical protein [Haladaptatus salinisoli]|uniref:hypothetical protein n=1 Tax=Haladaptatus salinisoli TaxID=2884876 RepID=UPI001D0B0A72|nr:hypothetical protein [Haladaptatus salinisoli]